jgi:hypothetical protein
VNNNNKEDAMATTWWRTFIPAVGAFDNRRLQQFQEQIGRRAAAMVLERLRGTVGDEGRCEEMPYELVIRAST